MPSTHPRAISSPPLLVLPLIFLFSTKARKPTQPMYKGRSFLNCSSHTHLLLYIYAVSFLLPAKCGCESVTFPLICIISQEFSLLSRHRFVDFKAERERLTSVVNTLFSYWIQFSSMVSSKCLPAFESTQSPLTAFSAGKHPHKRIHDRTREHRPTRASFDMQAMRQQQGSSNISL